MFQETELALLDALSVWSHHLQSARWAEQMMHSLFAMATPLLGIFFGLQVVAGFSLFLRFHEAAAYRTLIILMLLETLFVYPFWWASPGSTELTFSAFGIQMAIVGGLMLGCGHCAPHSSVLHDE